MPRLVEVEDDAGRGVTVGEWKRLRGDYWALRITEADLDKPRRGAAAPRPSDAPT
jgi:hypothetical protein